MDPDIFSFRRKSSLHFVVQVFFSTVVLALCVFQTGVKDNKDIALYWGGITSIIAYWMPSPLSANAQGKKSDEHNKILMVDTTIEGDNAPPSPPTPLPAVTEDEPTQSNWDADHLKDLG